MFLRYTSFSKKKNLHSTQSLSNPLLAALQKLHAEARVPEKLKTILKNVYVPAFKLSITRHGGVILQYKHLGGSREPKCLSQFGLHREILSKNKTKQRNTSYDATVIDTVQCIYIRQDIDKQDRTEDSKINLVFIFG